VFLWRYAPVFFHATGKFCENNQLKTCCLSASIRHAYTGNCFEKALYMMSNFISSPSDRKKKKTKLNNYTIQHNDTSLYSIARVNKGSHSFTCYTRLIHKWNEPILPLLPNPRALPHFGRYAFPTLLRVGGLRRVQIRCCSDG